MKTTQDNALWLDETLAGLRLDKVFLCGLSIGGWNAANYAGFYPEKVIRLILLSPVQTFAKMYPSFFFKIMKMGFHPTRENVESYIGWGSEREEPLPDSIIKLFTNLLREWSHQRGLVPRLLAGEGYWPYTLYHYNVAEESFEQIAQVDMWSKAVSTVNEQGEPYPDDIDAEGAGTVFILTHQGMVDTISQTDYEQWLSDMMGSTAELDIPYQALSEENIEALK